MKKTFNLIIALILAAGAAWLTPKLMADPGVLVLRLGGYQIEMRALVALGLLILAISAFWLTVWIIRAPRRAARGLAHRRGRTQFNKGLLALSEGRWPQAEKWLLASAKTSPTPELSYMAAARAAMAQNHPERAAAHLDQAEAHTDNPLTVDLTRAELWLKTGQTEQATALLERILKSYPNNPRALSLLLQAARRTGQWDSLRRHLPRVRRLGLLSDTQAQQLASQSLLDALRNPADQYALLKTWSQAGPSEKNRPEALTAFARSAARLGLWKEAITALEKHLKKHWPDDPGAPDSPLETWAEIALQKPGHAIAQAQKWLKKHPDSAALYKTLGLAWTQQGNAEKARENLEKAAQLGTDRQVLLTLADWYEQHGDTQAALDCHKRAGQSAQALVLPDSAGGRSNTPAPASGRWREG